MHLDLDRDTACPRRSGGVQEILDGLHYPLRLASDGGAEWPDLGLEAEPANGGECGLDVGAGAPHLERLDEEFGGAD